MNAQVSYSKDISYSLMYGQNPKKGGEVLLHQGVDTTLSAEEQAQEWQEMSNNYKQKLCSIIISFSDEDTAIIRSIPSKERRIQFERELIMDFIHEMAARGNNIDEAPFIVAHHDNTDNEHFHISVLMTTLDGKRFKDKMIGQNAQRACAKISMRYGLQGCQKAVERERGHQRVQNRKARADEKSHLKQRKSQVEQDIDFINKKMHRREAIQQAKKRRTMVKYIVEEVARKSNVANFKDNLAKESFQLYWDKKNSCWGVRGFLDGKIRSYNFKSLKVDISLVPAMQPPMEAKEFQTVAVSHTRTQTPTLAPAPQPSNTVRRSLSGIGRSLNQQGGSGDENREYEVGDHEGYEESIRRESRGRGL